MDNRDNREKVEFPNHQQINDEQDFVESKSFFSKRAFIVVLFVIAAVIFYSIISAVLGPSKSDNSDNKPKQTVTDIKEKTNKNNKTDSYNDDHDHNHNAKQDVVTPPVEIPSGPTPEDLERAAAEKERQAEAKAAAAAAAAAEAAAAQSNIKFSINSNKTASTDQRINDRYNNNKGYIQVIQ